MKKAVASFAAAVSLLSLVPTASAASGQYVHMSQRLLRELTVRERWRVKPFMGYQGLKRFEKIASGSVLH